MELYDIIILVAMVMGISLIISIVGLTMIMRRIQTIDIPHTTDFFTTLHHVPLSLVILLDLLDFSLDMFAAPISWVILNRMGLQNLRNAATIQAIVPGSSMLPMLTISWVLARMFNLGKPNGGRLLGQ